MLRQTVQVDESRTHVQAVRCSETLEDERRGTGEDCSRAKGEMGKETLEACVTAFDLQEKD